MRFACLRWPTPQKRASQYPAGRVMHVVLDASPVGTRSGQYASLDRLAAYRFTRSFFVCFPCLPSVLVSFLSSLAFPTSPLPSDSGYRRSFLTSCRLSCFDYHSFSGSNLDTDRFSHTIPHGLLPAGLTSYLFVRLSPYFSPPFLHSLYCLYYKHPRLVSPKPD